MFAKAKKNPFEKKKPAKKRGNEPGRMRSEWADLDREIEEFKESNKTVTLPGTWTVEDYNYFIAAIIELIERDSEAINLYKPLPTADLFHRCLCHEIGLSGSNRAGKTTTAAAEVAMAALGVHYLEGKYPSEGVNIAAIGNDGRHLSLMFEYLFEKAPFKVYQHPLTYRWSVVVEDDPECQKYKYLWQDAKPMIPERMIKYISWENKKEKIPKSVRLQNGTTIRFYSGLVRKMPQGRSFHLVWMDEEIEQSQKWVQEMRARIADCNGRIFWSATPQRASQEFFDMEMEAADPDNDKKPLSEQTGFFVMLGTDNLYISKVGNAAFLAKMKDDQEQVQTRFFGKSSRGFLTVYAEFGEHNLITDYSPEYDDTKYIIIDPGVDVAAVLFVACPVQGDIQAQAKYTDQEKWYRTRADCLVCYDELYIRKANPEMVAEAIKAKLAEYPTSWIQDFTIDQKGGRSMIWRGMGKDETCEGLYMAAIRKYDINPVYDRWRYGSSNVKYGVEKTKGLLHKDFDKLPRIFIHRRCKKLIWEMKVWKKKRDAKGEFIGYEEANNHLLDCLRYATTRTDLCWTPPPAPLTTQPVDLQKVMNDLRSGAGFFR